MSIINVQCTDQALAITNSPLIASGGVNEDYIQFSFCSLWTGYAKICVFYRQGENYYYSLVDSDDKCKIPNECLVSPGKFYLGVVGTNADEVTRTSEILSYQIVQGVMTEIPDPTPEIYQQILAELAEIRQIVEGRTIPDGSITTAKLANEAVSKYFTATITATWTGDAAPYTQEIAVNGMLATDRPFVDLIPSSTWETAEAELEAFGKIFRIVPAANSITVYATEATTTPMNIQMEVHRK